MPPISHPTPPEVTPLNINKTWFQRSRFSVQIIRSLFWLYLLFDEYHQASKLPFCAKRTCFMWTRWSWLFHYHQDRCQGKGHLDVKVESLTPGLDRSGNNSHRHRGDYPTLNQIKSQDIPPKNIIYDSGWSCQTFLELHLFLERLWGNDTQVSDMRKDI